MSEHSKGFWEWGPAPGTVPGPPAEPGSGVSLQVPAEAVAAATLPHAGRDRRMSTGDRFTPQSPPLVFTTPHD